jgi:hypothetical protein
VSKSFANFLPVFSYQDPNQRFRSGQHDDLWGCGGGGGGVNGLKSYFFLYLKGDCDCFNSDDIPASMNYLNWSKG